MMCTVLVPALSLLSAPSGASAHQRGTLDDFPDAGDMHMSRPHIRDCESDGPQWPFGLSMRPLRWPAGSDALRCKRNLLQL